MVKWNDIPWNEKASPEEKAQEFDAQFAENKAAGEEKDMNTPWFPNSPSRKVRNGE